MFDCCCSCTPNTASSRWNNLLTLARAYSLVGLLRTINDNTPDDLVWVYLTNTDKSGLLSKVKNTLNEHYSYTQLDESLNALDKPRFGIPRSVYKMAKEYMIRCYWDQVYGVIYDGICRSTFETDFNGYFSNKLYPIKVLNAIDATFIPPRGTLLQIDSKLHALHTAIFAGNPHPGHEQRSEKTDRTLSASQERKLNDLWHIIREFTEECISSNKLPTGIENTTLCDFMDIFLAIYSETPVRTAVNYKKIYDYSKLNDSAESGFHKFMEYRDVYRQHDRWSGLIDATVNMYRYMSPQAVICTGRNIAIKTLTNTYKKLMFGNTFDSCNVIEFLKKLNPRPSTEVELFVEKEICVQKRKLDEYIKKHSDQCEDHCCKGSC